MSFMFFHRGIVTRDSDEDRAFIAFSISMTTRMDRDIVEPVRVVTEEGLKVEQSVPA